MYHNVGKSEAVCPAAEVSLFFFTFHHSWDYSLDVLFLHALLLAHGLLAVNNHLVGIMDDPVADGISQDWITNLFPPSGHRKLGADDRRSVLVSGFRNFQKIPRFSFLQRVQQPFVQNQQRASDMLSDNG